MDLEQVQLVYNSRHFKSLATGGNVSQALALVGEKACYQSVSSYAGQIIYLGTKSAHMMTLRSWRERIDFLLKQDSFVEALSLAWSFHESTAKAVVGLCGDPAKRKGVVGDKMVEILLQFTEHALKKCPEQGKIQVMEQHFHDVVPVLVDYCLLLQRLDLLFNQLYCRLLENVVAKGVFLEVLESYIVADRLGHLTTPIMRDLLAHYHGNGMMDSLERCIVHLDVTSLDIQQVVNVCWDNKLYDAMMYVFNSGMNDYITPLEKLFSVISCPLREGRSLTDEEVIMGNKVLVYISCCLAGRAYPRGDIPEDLVTQVKNQVFDFLIRLHSADSTEEEDVFPFIRTLLHFDTREFLNVLAMTFEDFKNDKQALEYQQRIVDILLQVMVDNPDFTPQHLFVNRNLFDQVLEFLCSPVDDSRHTERQQEEIFSFIHNLLSMPGYSAEEKQAVRHKALLHVKELVCVDAQKSSDLVLFHFSDQVESILSMLQEAQLQFNLLRCLLGPRDGPCPAPGLTQDLALHELFLELMCRFAPEQLLDFLQSSQQYRLEEAIQITDKYHHNEASAYLLEKKGDVHGAFNILLEMLKEKLGVLTGDWTEGSPEEESARKQLEQALNTVTEFCHRSSVGLNQQQTEGLWFPLLEAMMASQKNVTGARGKHCSEVLKELTMKVLNSMSTFISLPAIIQRILQDPVYGKGKLAEIQGLILGMLDTFNYEQTLLETTTSLLNHDLHWSLAHLHSTVKRGLHPRQDSCIICLQQYKRKQDSSEEIIVFSCGHLYHLQCLQQKDCGLEQNPQNRQWSCYKCSSSQGGRSVPLSQLKRGRTASLAQASVDCNETSLANPKRLSGYTYVGLCVMHLFNVCIFPQTRVTSVHHDADSERKKFFVEATLDHHQEQSWDQLRTMYRGPSRLSILSELSHSSSEKSGLLLQAQTGADFQLKLSPPPLVEE
ncbi:hypothetical protein WMY93_018577 [Mugilogobius chulae]|uniref:RING-type domain-containing protein n=1 Tax=Mugilogobius chulae TaxID=88201 RepID=A0AAW0NM16_9GOBI